MSGSKGETSRDLASIRHALNRALDRAGSTDDQKEVVVSAMEPFIGEHRRSLVSTRVDQNRALKDLEDLTAGLATFYQGAKQLLLRGRYSSGRRKHTPGELAEMEGTPSTHYADTTGESAIWDEDITDGIARTIADLAQTIRSANSIKEWLLALSSTDVVERAKRTIPDCMACEDACVGRVLAGFDEKCYKRWVRTGRPDRNVFIAAVRRERSTTTEAAE